MVCIYCSGETQVVNSRHQKRANNVWRRRKCLICKAIFSTIEQPDTTRALRVHQNSHLEPFSAEKLLISVYDSLRHRKTAVEDAAALSATIQSQLYQYIENATVERDVIVEVAASVLDRFDTVAAVHYRAFHPSS